MNLTRTCPILALAGGLAALVLAGPAAAACHERGDLFHLQAHSLNLGAEAVSYFTWRPKGTDPARAVPLLVVVSPGNEEPLAFASRTRLLETAEAQGATLVLLDGLDREGRALDLVLDEVLARVG